MDAWIEQELSGCDLGDRRLDRRLNKLLEDLSSRMGQAIPLACQDWAATKAAYRFLDNPRVNEAAIFEGHFQATRIRFADAPGLNLVLHDTTEFSFQRTRIQAIGKTRKTAVSCDSNGRPRLHTVCGLLMHSSLVVTTQGLPLGLAAVKFWTRKKFKGTNALRGKVNATRVPIEEKESYRWLQNLRQATDLLAAPQRCVHIGDRESDIFELFCTAEQLSTHFLVRTCVDRLAVTGNTTIATQMRKADRDIHVVQLTDDHGKSIEVELEVRFRQMMVLPPIGKQKRYPALSLTAIHARETTRPKGRQRIEWKLLTNLPVTSMQEAAQKLDWYAMRWKIETFHKILKSGCKAEDARLRTASRLTNLIAVFCMVSWRVFWLCMINRTAPQTPAGLVFTDTEQKLLDRVDPKPPAKPKRTVSHYLHAVARLGGYLSRTSDRPPGNMVLWRGFTRLVDIHLGYCLREEAELVGN